jgi:gamma-glutamyltranspeptidase/glutathione hydrolase
MEATREMFVRERKGDTHLSQTGALAVAVPGALAAYDLAVTRFGKLPLASHLLAAAEIAENGFAIGRTYAGRLKANAPELREFESSRTIFLRSDGTPRAEGELLAQIDLAHSYRNIAEHGVKWFYEGPFAQMTAEWMQHNGGLLSADDFKRYAPKLRAPLRSTYRDCEIVTFPPPSSGGVHLLQILNIIENFDLRALGHNSVDTIHLIAEAMKLAFADRAFWLGDSDFVPVPRGLIDKGYAKTLAAKIDMKIAATSIEHSTPENAVDDIFDKHTTHFSTADDAGNWVACTATINTAFGSKVVVPGTGILLNNEMDDFSTQPGVPNAFGLVGGDANAVAPGKRPLSSMTPTIVLKEGRPIVALGAAGGPTIISQTLLAIINVIDFQLDLPTAIAASRFHHQWVPDELRIESSTESKLRDELRRRGHHLNEVNEFGACHAVGRAPDEKRFVGAADPRTEGAAGTVGESP